MRVIENDAPEYRVACRPWDKMIVNPRSYTIPSDGWDSSHEVKMTFGDDGHFFEDDCRERYASNVLWTQAASGGCWPFAVLIRNTGADRSTNPLTWMALAHLAYDRENEARLMGRMVYHMAKARPANVFLIAMIEKTLATRMEIELIKNGAFFSFEVGFRARVPDMQRIILRTNTVNAAVTRTGYFGELSNQDVSCLSRYQEPLARPCTIIPD